MANAGDSFAAVADSSRLSSSSPSGTATGALVTTHQQSLASVKAPTINGRHGDTVLIETETDESHHPANVSFHQICLLFFVTYIRLRLKARTERRN